MHFENLSQILTRSFLEIPDQVSIVLQFSSLPDREITYRELFQASSGYAQNLADAGIGQGEVVILILNHGEDLIYAFFGTILQGAIPSIMPFLTEKLSPDHYRSSLLSLVRITAPTAIITYPEFVEEIHRASQGTSVRAILVTDQINRQSTVDENTNPDELPGLQSSPADIVLLQHSSGSTGLQKGVALSHQAIINQLESYSQALHLNSSDVIVSWLPLYHDMGLIAGFIFPVLNRLLLILMSPFDWVRAPFKLLQSITRYHATLCWLPNFAYNFSAQKIRDKDLVGIDLSSMRAIINCSEPIYYKSHEMFLERFKPYGLRPEALATSYAMAENVFAVTQGGIDAPVRVDVIDRQEFLLHQIAKPIQKDAPELVSATTEKDLENANWIKMVSSGKPIAGTRLKVLNSQGVELPERHIGEIALNSNCMLNGYFNRPDLTEKAFLGGWYLTGDLGYQASGEVFITGRKKDLIIVGGKNIYPQDIEQLASEVKGVHPGRVVAFGVFNEQNGTEDVVVIAESDLLEESTLAIDSHIANEVEHIAAEIRDKVTRNSDVALRYVHIVGKNWLLKTSSGKIARSANHDKYLSELMQGDDYNLR